MVGSAAKPETTLGMKVRIRDDPSARRWGKSSSELRQVRCQVAGGRSLLEALPSCSRHYRHQKACESCMGLLFRYGQAK